MRQAILWSCLVCGKQYRACDRKYKQTCSPVCGARRSRQTDAFMRRAKYLGQFIHQKEV